MIIVKDCVYVNSNTVHLKVYADAILEIGDTIPGVPDGYDIQPGSFAYDENGNVAIYDSNGNWNAVE